MRSFSLIFSTKNVCVFGNKVVKHLMSWPLNELVKLTMLWTTGPWCTTNHIYSAIRQGFLSLEWLQITKSVLWKFAIIQVLPFLNNPKDLDPSYQKNLDFWDCFGRNKLCLITEEIRYQLNSYNNGSEFGCNSDLELWKYCARLVLLDSGDVRNFSSLAQE